MDLIEKSARERAKNYYYSNPQIKNVKLIDKETENIITCECGNSMFKLYKKFGGLIVGKYRKIINPGAETIYNYVCKCGNRLVLKEESFSFAKIKYGCSAGKCPFGKKSMDKECLTCDYIYEK